MLSRVSYGIPRLDSFPSFVAGLRITRPFASSSWRPKTSRITPKGNEPEVHFLQSRRAAAAHNDAMQTQFALLVERELSGSPSAVWRTWTDSAAYSAVRRTHSSTIDLRVAGEHRVAFFADRPGEETFVYTEIEPEERLVFHWKGHPEGLVHVDLVALSEARTLMRIRQDCGSESGWVRNAVDGWAWVCDSTEQFLTTGRGISNDEWSSENRKETPTP